MARLVRKRSVKSGLPPGTIVHIGDRKSGETRITVLNYGESRLEEKEVKTVDECLPYRDSPGVTWFCIEGIHHPEVIEQIGRHFNLHPLLQEDIANTEQRPKMEDYGDYIYIVLKALSCDEKTREISHEQVSIILGKNFVISFQEGIAADVFAGVRERIRAGKGRHRASGADYLVYSLVDSVVDNYFMVLEMFDEKIEAVEEQLIKNPSPATLQNLQRTKRELIVLRKSVWPVREILNSMERCESQFFQHSTRLYIRDVYDHTIQVIDNVETFRDILSEMMDIYLSSISNRLNEVMKVLTIIATIFIPLTFVAGVYGMNFKFMPELETHWGYPAILIVMFSVAIGMLFYFKRKKWM